MSDERRKGDLLVKLILLLFGILQTIITAWAYNTSTKVEDSRGRILILEANYGNMKPVLEEVRSDVKKLLTLR